jgi:hypothetical protein
LSSPCLRWSSALRKRLVHALLRILRSTRKIMRTISTQIMLFLVRMAHMRGMPSTERITHQIKFLAMPARTTPRLARTGMGALCYLQRRLSRR